MVKRSTWIMIALLAVLAGLAYYLQQPDNLIKKAFPSATGTPTAEPLGTLLSPTDAPLNSISVQGADGHSAVIERTNTGWLLLIDGESVPADQAAAEQIASQAPTVRLVETIKTATPDTLSAFGLDKPAYIYKLNVAGGKFVTFKIGNTTLSGSGYYLQKEDGSVVVIDNGIDLVLGLLRQPPYKFTPTPSSVPVTETPTPSEDTAGTLTPTAELTATKQP
jgi:hypothetical protein